MEPTAASAAAAVAPATILVVEDNPMTSKMVALALRTGGYAVALADDGGSAIEALRRERPALVLMDMQLPDTDGAELVGRMRSLPEGTQVPILAFSGHITRIEEARAANSGFTDFVPKPVSPSVMLDIIRGHLAGVPSQIAQQRLLLVDDDPVQRGTLRLHLLGAGYEVVAVDSGAQALAAAREHAPDVIVSDVVMPGMDGFELCLAFKADAALRQIPVVLCSAHFVEEEDRQLARAVGASEYVCRSGGAEEVLAALRLPLRPAQPEHGPEDGPDAAAPAHHRRDRIVRQLERQLQMQTLSARRSRMQNTILAQLGAITDSLAAQGDANRALGDMLSGSLNAAGLSTGLIYIVEADGQIVLRAHTGSLAQASRAEALFGLGEFFAGALQQQRALACPSPDTPAEVCRTLLAGLEAGSLLLLPLASRGRTLGLVVVASRTGELVEPDWLEFGRTFALQMGHAIQLIRSYDAIAQQAALLDKASDAIIVLGVDERISFWNRGAERVYDWTAAQAVGRPVRELLQETEDAASRAWRSEVLTRGEWNGRVLQRRQNGQPLTVDLHATLVRDAAGWPGSVLTIATDITQRIAMEQQLQQAQRLEAVGQLTGGIAHDFNNLLTVILGNAELLVEQLGNQPQLRPLAEMTRSAAQRGAELTHRLLAFARRQQLTPRAVDIAALLAGMRELMRRTISETIAIEIAVAPGSRQPLADAAQLENAILNLSLNARDAMPEGGRIDIAVDNTTLDDAFASRHPGARPGPYVHIRVADTGHGIAPENLGRVFEPFFTTKAFGKGTGLGLSMVYGFVQQSQGYVTIASQPGRGTQLDLYLPVADAAAAAPPPANAPKVAAGTGRVLLVEDEVLLRQFAETLLHSLGYEVIAAADADAALAVIRADTAIDLLFTDVVIPVGMNGVELARAAQALRPGLKVLCTSGYADSTVLQQQPADAAPLPFLPKPYRRADLAEKLRAVLASAP